MKSAAEASAQDPPMQGHPAIDALAATLGNRAEVQRVILFGSRACGDADERSDIDLAIDAPKATEEQCSGLCQLAENAETLLPIDMVWLQAASPALRQDIEQYGIVLHAKSA
jgi:predicted nucleotidyltransferase